MTGTPAPKPGLQIERTHLAWERTAMSFLAIAAIILFHHSGPLGPARTTLATLTILLSILGFLISRSRGRITVQTDRSLVRTPQVAVHVMGWGTALLALSLLSALALAR